MSAILIPSPEFRDAHDAHAHLCDEADETREPFGHDYTDAFIREFAESEGDAICWLENKGIGENYGKYLLGAELIRRLCKEWIVRPLVVYEIAGPHFWRVLTELSSAAYDNE